ncbi:unnamed protein product [Ectocarpus sp. CCAP 1310/34]|nr:unnamed protein product [Ectocarpus sp. CCAP 1310/34]
MDCSSEYEDDDDNEEDKKDSYDNKDDDDDDDDDDNDDSEEEEEREGLDGQDEGEQQLEGVKKAAAAMAVSVGNLSDPEHCQGLAHYLEHMLFMGSTKYPDENEYDSFISASGGSTNAFTECEYTLYHFDVLPQHLEKALDIFAQFFVSPLMKADSSDRELQSIESEFCLSKNNDSCRLQELCKFCWGNLHSLREEPQSKGVDVRQELVDFHAKHYRASAMQLVVQGGQTLDELQALVLSTFSGIAVAAAGGGDDVKKKKGGGEGGLPEESATVAAAGLPFDDAGALGRAFRVQPVKDVHRLHVTWQLGEQHRCCACWGSASAC